MSEPTLQTSIHTGIIRTLAGKKFNLFEPTPDMIDIRDISHGLANKGHFSGFTPHYFSIAEHSIMVCDEFSIWNNEQPDDVKLLALLHDAAEAYIGDMVKPLKVRMNDFILVENRIQQAICERFNMDFTKIEMVKPADIYIQSIEYHTFYHGGLGPSPDRKSVV